MQSLHLINAIDEVTKAWTIVLELQDKTETIITNPMSLLIEIACDILPVILFTLSVNLLSHLVN